MKKIKIIFIIGLIFLFFIPIINFNTESPSVSEIDNRNLTEFDFKSENVTDMIDSYIKDRIGFRTESINLYTELNDKMFGEMVHPTYIYGEKGYVFLKINQEDVDTEFVDGFCEYLKKIQDYCEERNVPFIYCLNPSKVSVYSEYLPKGYNYQNKFIKYMEKVLQEKEINYISNYELLEEKSKNEQVYNQKYDAGHWNDLGAFYGMNHILEKVSEYFPDVRQNTMEDFNVKTVVEKSLPVSYFKIDETVPVFENKNSKMVTDKTNEYMFMKMHEKHRFLRVSDNQEGNDLPNVLFFHGSYLNGRSRFYESRFGNVFAVHNYENLLDFEYYFNIAQPECVILETAEYATTRDYFNYDKMINKRFNNVLGKEKKDVAKNLSEYEVDTITKGNLTEIVIKKNKETFDGGYLLYQDRVFDFQFDEKNETVSCTIENEYYNKDEMKVVFY